MNVMQDFGREELLLPGWTFLCVAHRLSVWDLRFGLTRDLKEWRWCHTVGAHGKPLLYATRWLFRLLRKMFWWKRAHVAAPPPATVSCYSTQSQFRETWTRKRPGQLSNRVNWRWYMSECAIYSRTILPLGGGVTSFCILRKTQELWEKEKLNHQGIHFSIWTLYLCTWYLLPDIILSLPVKSVWHLWSIGTNTSFILSMNGDMSVHTDGNTCNVS